MLYRHAHALITAFSNLPLDYVGEYYLVVNYHVSYHNSRFLQPFAVNLIPLDSNTKLITAEIAIRGRRRPRKNAYRRRLTV